MTESISFSMANPTVINAHWAKGKCDTGPCAPLRRRGRQRLRWGYGVGLRGVGVAPPYLAPQAKS